MFAFVSPNAIGIVMLVGSFLADDVCARVFTHCG